MRPPSPDSINEAHALGLLLIGAIDHLTARAYCCPHCCCPCAGLSFYWAYAPEHVSETAVGLALGGQPVDWYTDQKINWPYLVQFWETPADHECG